MSDTVQKKLQQDRFHIGRYGNSFHFGNKFLFIGWRPYNAELINEWIQEHPGSLKYKFRFHIVLCNDDQINKELIDTINKVCHLFSNAKIAIYIPDTLSAIKSTVLEKLKDAGIDINAAPYYNKLHITVRDRQLEFNIHSGAERIIYPKTEGRSCLSRPKYKIYVSMKGMVCAVSTVLYHSDPMPVKKIKKEDRQLSESEIAEQNKDELIAKFKATTTMSILKSFKDEDDIWDFICMENGWAKSPKDKNVNLIPKCRSI